MTVKPRPYALRAKSIGHKVDKNFEKEINKKPPVRYNLPREYLSYSAISLWQKDKRAFRDKYYLNRDIPETPYMIFGKKIAKLLESDEYKKDPVLSKIPKFGKAEHQIKTVVEGIPILAYIDRFSIHARAFKEYKTGILSPMGDVPWDQVKVEKHDQLPFYSFLIKQVFGYVREKCELVWMETRWKQKKEMVMGYEVLGDSRELELTGRFEVFTRAIKPWEHKRIREMIVRAAEEITIDYTNFQNQNNAKQNA